MDYWTPNLNEFTINEFNRSIILCYGMSVKYKYGLAINMLDSF